MSKPVQGTEAALQSLRDELKTVILNGLKQNATSQSNVPGRTITGNRYQTVDLGDVVVPGFRDRRDDLFVGLDFTGKTVCDLGANLGETARDMARRGADRVDAYEYDRFFTMLGSLISIYNGQPNVFHYAEDVSQPGFMKRQYDICAALAVYAYIEKNTEYVTSKVNQYLIVETHEVDKNWHARYVGKLGKKFPHWGCFGIIRHGDTMDSNKRRLRLIFSRERPLDSFYVRRNAQLGNSADVSYLDVASSDIPVLSGARMIFDGRPDNRLSKARVTEYRQRLKYYDEKYRFGDWIELSVVGEVYWLSFVVGLLDYIDQGRTARDNIYAIWLRRAIENKVGDPGLASLLADESAFFGMVERRLSEFAELVDRRKVRDSTRDIFPPIVAYNPTPDHPSFTSPILAKFKFEGHKEVLRIPTIDGHHRLFMCKLLDFPYTSVRTFWDPSLLRFSSEEATGSNYKERIIQYLAGIEVSPPVFS